MKNQGKIFEDDFRNSLDLDNPDLFFYRFKDGTASWGDKNNPNVRFQQKNISDCMLFYKEKLFIVELKSHKGKSLPLNCIRDNQFIEMYKASFKKNVYPIVIIFFSDIQECYGIKMTDIIEFRAKNISKSIPLLFAREKGLKIDCRKKLTHYTFNILDFLDNFIEKQKKEGI